MKYCHLTKNKRYPKAFWLPLFHFCGSNYSNLSCRSHIPHSNLAIPTTTQAVQHSTIGFEQFDCINCANVRVKFGQWQMGIVFI
jgi:hypothetical protein